jgi:predicted dehydrogenase
MHGRDASPSRLGALLAEVLIIGTGKMGQEYARLYRDGFGVPFSVAGRSIDPARAFAEKQGALSAHVFDSIDENDLRQFDTIVVAASEENLEGITLKLLGSGVKKILLEKPGALDLKGARAIAELSDRSGAKVRIACNRRYYKSVRALKNILASEPALSCTFEFTELSNQISALAKPALVKARWGLINPIHVLDTVGFLLGPIAGLNAKHSGKDEIDWHPLSAIFQGSAEAGGTPVSYSTNWLSPGRWDLQVMTRQGRYKLSPMEKLVVMRPDSKFQWLDVELPPEPFKPGLYDMVAAFSQEGKCDLPDLHENLRTLTVLSEIFGYPRG